MTGPVEPTPERTPGPPVGPPPGVTQPYDYLGPAAPAARRRRRPVLVSLGVVVLLLVGGGAYAAYSALNGGGPQPEDALPGNVIGYAEVDLDPAAGQKLGAYRLAKRFPDAKVSGESSIKDDLLRGVFSDDDVDYDTDVKPWIGDRVGIAVLDALDEDSEPVPVLAVQYRDRGKAKAGLDRLVAADDAGETGYAFGSDGYVLVAESDAIAQKAVDDARRSPLSDNDRYTRAQDALGGDTVAFAWADLEGIFDVIPKDVLAQAGPFQDADPKGSYVVGVSVSSDAVEVRGRGVDVDLGELGDAGLSQGGSTGRLLAALPEDSLGALSVVGLDRSLKQSYEQITSLSDSVDGFDAQDLDDLAAKAGVRLPDDLSALFGDETAVAVLPGSGDEPGVGARTRGGDPERGRDVLSSVAAYAAGGDPKAVPLDDVVTTTDDGLVVGSAPDVRDALAEDGRLGSTDAFRKAVPEADAPFAMFVNLSAVFDGYDEELGLDERARANTRPLDAVGLSIDGSAFRLRVTFR